MPRRMTEEEKTRATVAWDFIVASIKDRCSLIYTPTIIQALVEHLGMSKDDAVQAIRDLLSLNLLEMHFDQELGEVAAKDEPFVFPAPAATSKVNVSPYALPYMRRAQKPEDEPCGLDHCGANAPDFKQPPLLPEGEYEWQDSKKQWHKTRVKYNVEDYDLIAVNSSGGKDSQAMLDAVFRECRRLGIEDRIHVYFADLQRAEWLGTAEIAELQAKYYGLPFDNVKRPQGDLIERMREKGEWPGPQFRYCTSDLKRGQVNRLFTRDAKEIHAKMEAEGKKKRPVRILNCLGIRSEESDARSKKLPFRAKHPDYSSGDVRHVDAFFPIYLWKHDEVWETIARSGVPHHWAYDLSMPRLSCPLCIYGDKNCLMLGGMYNPEMLDLYVELEHYFLSLPQTITRKSGEKGVRASLFKNKEPIEDVRDALERGERPSGTFKMGG